MNLNERHAAIAVLFLVAVLLVGFFWQDGSAKSQPQAAGANGEERLARLEESALDPGVVYAGEREARGGDDSLLPMAGHDDVGGDVQTVTTRGLSGDEHRVDPGSFDRGAGDRGASDRGAVTGGAGSGAPAGWDPAPRSEDRVDLQPRTGADLAETLRPVAPARDDELAEMADSFREDGPFLSRKTEPERRLEAETSAEVASSRKAEREAKATTAAKKPSASGRTYTVKAGDALSLIASRECGSSSAVDDICRLNGLTNPDKIRVDMVLQLPARAKKVAKAATEQPRVASSGAGAAPAKGNRRTVTIQSGEMLSNVLVRELGTYARSIAMVKELNPGLNPDRVVVGQKIVLPLPAELPAGTSGSRRAPTGTVIEAPRLASTTKRSKDPKYTVR